MDLLGPTLGKALELAKLKKVPAGRRWQLVSLVGRLLLRRLKALHERGWVHCDLNPGNVLVGRRGEAEGPERWRPFLVDFGSAQREGAAAPAHLGTVEFNSVRSADGGCRLPWDDLEGLGWMLCFFILGDLPWRRAV